MKISGTVATGGLVTGSCPNLRFVVVVQSGAAYVVFTDAATQFVNGACSGISGALQVQVSGTQQADGSILAAAVQSQDHTGG